MDKVSLLIDILFDKTAREDERDDAASYLGDYADERALEALLKVASNPDEDVVIVDTCGTSIGEILVKMNINRVDILAQLPEVAQDRAKSYISSHKPEWS